MVKPTIFRQIIFYKCYIISHIIFLKNYVLEDSGFAIESPNGNKKLNSIGFMINLSLIIYLLVKWKRPFFYFKKVIHD